MGLSLTRFPIGIKQPAMKSVYLDNAATTPMAPEVLEAILPYMREHFGNPSSTHAFGRKTKTAIEQARRNIARHLNCTPGEITFTSGGTEADNMALHAAATDLNCTAIITSAIEHSAVVKTAEYLCQKHGLNFHLVRLLPNGHVDLNHLEELLAAEPKAFVSLMHGNNEIGNLLPLATVGHMCRKHGAVFHSDTVQTMGHYAFDLQNLPIDFITCAGHKFNGPKGVGFLYIRKELKIKPIILGGGQERQMRGGTENLYGIVGLSKAFDLAYGHLAEHQNHIRALKQHMVNRLETELEGVIFNGDSKSPDSLYTVLNVTLPENPNSPMMLFLLDLEGIACSGGSACSSGAAKPSHVLDAIGAVKQDRASVRFSFGRYTTKDEIDFAVERILELCAVVPAKA
jgi:cysteine desulfurase